MNIIKLPDFNTVAPGTTATLRIPKWNLTLCRLVLKLGVTSATGATFTKAHVTDVRVKIGNRVVW